jgi:hypothetical protein
MARFAILGVLMKLARLRCIVRFVSSTSAARIAVRGRAKTIRGHFRRVTHPSSDDDRHNQGEFVFAPDHQRAFIADSFEADPLVSFWNECLTTLSHTVEKLLAFARRVTLGRSRIRFIVRCRPVLDRRPRRFVAKSRSRV